MTITLENQFVCRFSAGPYKDFIVIEDLKELVYIESAGNMLPVLNLKFTLRNPDVLNYLNEGNIFNVSMGRTQLELIDMQFRLIRDLSSKNYSLGDDVFISGVLNVPKYSAIEKSNCYGNKSSLEVIKEISSKYFNFKTNIDRTNDKQYWTQAGQTDMNFVKNTWFHSYINDNTFIALAIDANTFYLKDINKTALTETPWLFSSQAMSSENSKIIHFGQYTVKNDYGVANELIGRNTLTMTRNTDFGDLYNEPYNLKNLTVLGSDSLNLMRDNNMQYTYSYLNTNVAPTYARAYDQNMRNLILFSSFRIYLSFSGQFKILNLLDLANLDLNSVEQRVTGRAFVTRIVYQLVNRRIITNVTLCKEAPNEIKGDLLK